MFNISSKAFRRNQCKWIKIITVRTTKICTRNPRWNLPKIPKWELVLGSFWLHFIMSVLVPGGIDRKMKEMAVSVSGDKIWYPDETQSPHSTQSPHCEWATEENKKWNSKESIIRSVILLKKRRNSIQFVQRKMKLAVTVRSRSRQSPLSTTGLWNGQ